MWLADAGEDVVDVLNRRLQRSHGKLLADLRDIDLDEAFPAEAVQSFRASWLRGFPRTRTNGSPGSSTCWRNTGSSR